MYRRIILLVCIVFSIIYTSTCIETSNINDNKTINVEVRGQVEDQQVLEMSLGSTISDVLKQVDLKKDSDISGLGLNETLKNNQIIVIPKIAQDNKVSINSASIDELMCLKGIGEKMANNIIQYRTNNGGFKSIEELMNVSGIGEKKFNQIKEFITL